MATKTFSDEIRDALNKCGMTRYRVWKLSGIDQTALMRFARGEAGMSLENIDKLAAVLRLHVTTDNKAKTSPIRPVAPENRPQRRAKKKRVVKKKSTAKKRGSKKRR